MSLFFPKRISELATIDSDLETPEKSKNNKHFGKNAEIMPKRINDIKESDSEDEDQLNCAILNDSFVLSPSKDIDIPSTPQQQEQQQPSACKKNRPNKENDAGAGAVAAEPAVDLDSRIASLKTKCSPETATRSVSDTVRPLRSRTQLFPPSLGNKEQSSALKESNNKKQQQQTIPTVPENRIPPSANATPLKAPEQQQFVTPSTRIFSSTHVNSAMLSSTADRDPIRNPFQPQQQQQNQQPKILFRTPVARPFSSASATPIESRPIQKLSPIKEPIRERPKENCITINSVEYEIDRKIGSGGSSAVYLARGRKSGKECAIKHVNLDGEPQVIEGYLNETRLLARLQGNINVVALYDYCHLPEKKSLYMVMEKGESDLHKALQQFTTHIPLYILMSWWYQMLQAVNYIHQNGVIHSDLKPANFLTINGRLKLIDFGIASNIAIDSTSIIKFSQAGTFNYISPEALIDTSNSDSPSTHHQPRIRLSTKSDVWSLGCILYLLLYKKTPFSHIKSIHQKVHALTNPVTSIDYPKLPNFYPDILLEMLKKCLVHNPKERASVADLLKYPFDMVIPIKE